MTGDVEALSPSARVEAQDYYARKFLADRKRRLFEVCKPRPWPRQVWHVNDSQRRLERELACRDGLPAR